MRRSVWWLFCLLLSTAATAQQNYNLVRTWVPQKPITVEKEAAASTRTAAEVMKQADYSDGFGRPVQTINWQNSPAGADAVTMHVYDAYGMETKRYLPFVSSVIQAGDITGDGLYKSTAVQQQAAFIQSMYSGESGSTGYSQINYENSPLYRQLKKLPQGSSWVSANRGKTTQYLVNTSADEVQSWYVPFNQATLPWVGNAYQPGQLYKIIEADEAGRQEISYVNNEGMIVLNKKQLTATADNGTGSAHSGWMCTYYLYDEFRRLRCTITPEAVRQLDGNWSFTQTICDNLCIRYEYDLQDRPVIKKYPGAAEQWFVYDKAGHQVMSQDGNQRAAHKWVYYSYDALDRPLAMGLLTDNVNYNNRSYHETNAAAAASYPNLASYATELLTKKFYDNYSWLTAAPLLGTSLDVSNAGNTSYFYAPDNSAWPYAQPLVQSNLTRGLVTGTQTEVLGSNGTKYLYTVSFYDDKGRVIQTQSTNVSGQVDKVTTQYSFNGNPLRVLWQQVKDGSSVNSHTVLTKLEYDLRNRLEKVTKSVASVVAGASVLSGEKTVATYSYDEYGRLKVKSLGVNGTTPLETLTYDYNIRGWQTGINKSYTQAGSTGHYFGMELGYDKTASTNGNTSFTPLYDGQVAGLLWKAAGDAVPRKYDFSYDKGNRLTTAGFTQNTAGTTWDKALDFSVSGIGYDLNGNIKSLSQNGFVPGGAAGIDQLTYQYTNNNTTNVLQSVTDGYNNAQSRLGDFHYSGTKAAGAVDYGYDDNGNRVSDANKNISSIVYNTLNLPAVITVTGKGTITYTYSAAGKKLTKQVQENNVTVAYNGTNYTTGITTVFTYIGDLVYRSRNFSNAALAPLNEPDGVAYFIHEEGRARLTQLSTGNKAWAFDYFIRDNLGNVRVILTDEQQQEIYPAATLETAGIASEQGFYTITNDAAHVVPVSSLSWWNQVTNGTYNNSNGLPVPPDKTVNPTGTSGVVYKLSGSGSDRFGLGITLKVMAGDQVSIFGKSVWHGNGAITNNNLVSNVVTSFLNAFAGTSAVVDGAHGMATGAALNSMPGITGALTTFLNSSQDPGTGKPRAYINWILFDEQFKPVANGAGFESVNDVQDAVKSHSRTGITMNRSGYLYVYCSNESNQDVYFDNLQVVHNHSALLEEAHYYPQGLLMAGISSRAFGKLPGSLGYQGKERQYAEWYDGTGLEEYDFEARYYDAQLARWHSQDPAAQFASPYVAMGNNWPNGVDPNGKWFGIDDIIVSAVGFVVGYVSYGLTQGNWGGKALLTGLATAAIAEAGYLTLGGGLAATPISSVETVFQSAFLGGYGTLPAATGFVQSFALSSAFGVLSHFEQLHNASGWSAFGLIAGYSALNSLGSGFSSDAFSGKITDWLGVGTQIKGVNMTGALEAGVGGFVTTAGGEILEGYDPVSGKWNVEWGNAFLHGGLSGFAGSGLSTIGGNMVTDYIKGLKGNSWMTKDFFKGKLPIGASAVVGKGTDLIWGKWTVE